jgi:hypothetical protein
MCAAAGAGLELGLRRQAIDPHQAPTLQLQQLRLARRHHQTVVVALPTSRPSDKPSKASISAAESAVNFATQRTPG